jgi:type I restriction-modification system DNA methylase subunit
LADFLGGAQMDSRQFTVFSDYDFRVIPVETISAIYEEFMKEEDLVRKHDEGAFYTPRHLAETALHIAVENRYTEASKWSVLDPACGSGIFLVGMFNMLAAQWLRDNANRTKKTKAQALLEILQQRIRGVDVNLDACRTSRFRFQITNWQWVALPRLFEKHPL